MSEQSSHNQFSGNRNSALFWTVIAVCVLFSIPMVAMQLTSEVRWGPEDFLAWGCMLLVAGCAFLLLTRKLPRKKWLGAGAMIGVVFVYIWAELAVGVFTNLGS